MARRGGFASPAGAAFSPPREIKTFQFILQIRGDKATSLTLLINMRRSTSKIAAIAREITLKLENSSFPPMRFIHQASHTS